LKLGALGKVTNSRVIALRHELSVTDVRPPLSRFQSRPLDKKGVLARSINNVLPVDERRKDNDLVALFDTVFLAETGEQVGGISLQAVRSSRNFAVGEPPTGSWLRKVAKQRSPLVAGENPHFSFVVS
jgi:hypothetical protein